MFIFKKFVDFFYAILFISIIFNLKQGFNPTLIYVIGWSIFCGLLFIFDFKNFYINREYFDLNKVIEVIVDVDDIIISSPGEFIDENTGNLVSHSHVICGLQNCVYKAAREGLSVVNGTGYSTHSPCVRCGPVILSVGLKRFVYCQEYRIINHLEVLREQGVILHQIPLNIVNEFGDHYG